MQPVENNISNQLPEACVDTLGGVQLSTVEYAWNTAFGGRNDSQIKISLMLRVINEGSSSLTDQHQHVLESMGSH